ncbi:hypothetical protein N431DRAFT_457906 [Stipitochalara longipes BDJ]|nr:hypothetical protein N431DRAFT_457906 [Stipitochalara longipes BDJ]
MSNSATPTKRPASEPMNAGTPTKKRKYANLLEEPSFSSPHEVVTFHIGPELTPFIVHKEVACLHCPVFEAAFNSNFIEGQTQTYKIDDTTVEAFQYLVQWFYGQKFKSLVVSQTDIKIYLALIRIITSISTSQAEKDKAKAQLKTMPDPKISHKFAVRCSSLCRVWVLADRLQIPRVQNLVIDELERIRVDWGA